MPEITESIFFFIKIISLLTFSNEIIFKDKTGKTQGIKLRIIPPSKANRRK